MARTMKDSGIEWIGEIPREWKLYKIKHLFSITRGRVISTLELEPDGKYPVYSSQTENNGCFGYINTYDYSGDAITWTTDGAKAGTVFLRTGKYNCTNVCGILQMKKEYITGSYLPFLYYSILIVAEQNKRADINGYKIMSNEMAEIKLPYPPLLEQQKIADYLDDKCSKIDEITAKIKSTIDEYKKLKQSVITEAVTKGIRPNREMKDSGIEWIGEIPQHWTTIRIGRIFSLRDEKNYKPLEEVQLLSLYTDIGVFPHGEQEERGNKAVTADGYKVVKKNDIIVNIILAWMGAIGISNYEGVTSPAYDVYIPDLTKICPRFFHYLFRTQGIAGECFKYGRGIMLMRWRTYSPQFKLISVPYPNIKEQQEIADYLDKKCAEIDKLIAKKEQLLTELENYKKSLIYEYVTGKKEVV